VQITNIKLQNFKFHTKLDFPLKGNMLIYGENGTGKSSIYWALHSIFKKEQTNDIESFKKIGTSNDLNVQINIKNSEVSNTLATNNTNTICNNNFKTVYFVNQDLLESIIDYDSNFYNVLDTQFKKYFPMLNDFYANYERADNRLELGENHQEITSSRNKNTEKFESLLNETIVIANSILKDDFGEDINLSFAFDGGELQEDGNKFNNPNISLKIDNINTLKSHFNEAKLKLSSLAIFLALVKIQSKDNQENELKLLVLDDFLTSLDMANRGLIIEYIFNEFSKYQKIILTHNIQFSNLIKQFLKSRQEISNWDIKNIFTRKINAIEESIIYTKDDDFIKIAQDYIDDNKLQECGGYLRKEFERQVEELRIINELGIKQKLSDTINEILNSSTQKFEYKRVQKVLNNAKYYQDSILHASNHYDITTEVYEKDYKGSIKTLKELRKCILNLKQEKMKDK
jgi:recombinational DNA repair ATPase RecF